MKILKPSQLAWDGNSKTTIYTGGPVFLVHVSVRCSGGCFSVVDGLIPTVPIADKHEASATDARVIHPNDADAEGARNHGIGSSALDIKLDHGFPAVYGKIMDDKWNENTHPYLNNVDANLGAYHALAGDGAPGAIVR